MLKRFGMVQANGARVLLGDPQTDTAVRQMVHISKMFVMNEETLLDFGRDAVQIGRAHV